MSRMAILGSSGFIGRATTHTAIAQGHTVLEVGAPRFRVRSTGVADIWTRQAQQVEQLAQQFRDVDVVICAAGLPDASSRDGHGLFGANAALPAIVAAAAGRAGVRRMVQVSSAVVQGSRRTLDASLTHSPTSPYGRSKASGEMAVLSAPGPPSVVIYRPPSVHSADRRITRAIYKIANSSISSVMSPGDNPTPQAHITNVASGIVYLATCDPNPPPIVTHPWEGWTTETFLALFASGRSPTHLPGSLSPLVRTILHTSARIDALAPNARRLEMLWYGQAQEQSWLQKHNWSAPVGPEGWRLLVQEVACRND